MNRYIVGQTRTQCCVLSTCYMITMAIVTTILTFHIVSCEGDRSTMACKEIVLFPMAFVLSAVVATQVVAIFLFFCDLLPRYTCAPTEDKDIEISVIEKD